MKSKNFQTDGIIGKMSEEWQEMGKVYTLDY
jgi:hypothetical protein